MTKKSITKKPAVCMSIEVPIGGIELKLTNRGAIGTLTIEPQGIKFDVAKVKIRSDKLMTWEILKGISRSGLV